MKIIALIEKKVTTEFSGEVVLKMGVAEAVQLRDLMWRIKDTDLANSRGAVRMFFGGSAPEQLTTSDFSALCAFCEALSQSLPK